MRVALFFVFALASTIAVANDDIACRNFDSKCLPVIDTANTETTYVIGADSVVADPEIVLFYSDGPPLSAHLQFGEDAYMGEDVLGFQDTGNVTSSWEPETGSLFLWGAMSADELQSAMRQVTYRNIASSPHTGVRTVHWTVSTDVGFSGYTPSTINVVNSDARASGK